MPSARGKKQITPKEIESVLFDSPERVIKHLPELLPLGLIACFLGKQVRQYWDYYGRLLFHFAKEHPGQATALAGAIAYISNAEEDDQVKSFLAGASIAALAISVMSYRDEHRTKGIKQRLQGVRRKFDSMVLPKGGTVLTGDGKTFFEVKYKFGDSLPSLKTFVITDRGAKKYDRAEQKYDRKSFAAFFNEQKFVDVTECISPDIASFEW